MDHLEAHCQFHSGKGRVAGFCGHGDDFWLHKSIELFVPSGTLSASEAGPCCTQCRYALALQ
jgi:hypothetical protein